MGMGRRTRTGQLRNYVALWKFDKTRDAAGNVVRTPVKVCDLYARIEPLRGVEYFEAQRVGAEMTHRVTVWFDSRITPDHQFRFGTRRFNVTQAMNPAERGVKTECLCMEVV